MPLVCLEKGRISRLTLNHPESRNAMSEEMAAEFAAAVNELKASSETRVVILSGAGEAFSAGGHLTMLEEKTRLSPEENERKMLEFYEAFLSIQQIPVPVIAALNGHAIGAACCLSLACDIRVAVREAKLGLNFVALGLHPGMGASYFLPRLVGPALSAELLYSGSIVTAEEALRMCLVNRVCSAAEFHGEVDKLAARIAGNGPKAIRELKENLRAAPFQSLDQEGALAQALAREAKAQAGNYAGAEFREGITAAREKRTPDFK